MKKLLSCGLMAFAALACAASAAEYPSKPIRWIVPYAAGGGSDFLARTISQALSRQAGQPVIVENKPGGNTALGAAEVARAPGDGYSVLSADNGTMVFNPALYQNLTYDVAQLAPVSLMGRFPMILVAGPASQAKDAREFIEQTRAAGDGQSYGSAGAGSPHHLAMELLNKEAGLKQVHVPYRGAAPALTDVAGGQIPAMMVDLAAGAGFIQGGKVRALAVASKERLPQLPDVPTFAELGMPNIEAAALVGMVTSAATPPEVIEKLNGHVVAAIKDPEVNRRMIEFGIEPVGSTAGQYRDLLASETVRWHRLIRELGIKLD
ncbi:tripartite tricarboxylate transporter substrate binding protein [Orrella sp. JC864]|uniref:Bug family tripartite tricarboxylate transporter substrate binding protein n=1 Tax=Orrella sp. JC864 TaxID=3120298 RepID=UPI0030088B60